MAGLSGWQVVEKTMTIARRAALRWQHQGEWMNCVMQTLELSIQIGAIRKTDMDKTAI